jgi:hypothetical protein
VIPNRAAGRVRVRLFDMFASAPHVRSLVLTTTRDGTTRSVQVEHLGGARYTATLAVGRRDRLAVIAHLRNGKRMRSVFEMPS